MFKYHLNFVDITSSKSSGPLNVEVFEGLSEATEWLKKYTEETKARKIKKSSYVEITKVVYQDKKPSVGKLVLRKYVSETKPIIRIKEVKAPKKDKK